MFIAPEGTQIVLYGKALPLAGAPNEDIVQNHLT